LDAAENASVLPVVPAFSPITSGSPAGFHVERLIRRASSAPSFT